MPDESADQGKGNAALLLRGLGEEMPGEANTGDTKRKSRIRNLSSTSRRL